MVLREAIFLQNLVGTNPIRPHKYRRACNNSVANIQGGISLSCDTLYDIVFIECTIFNSNFFIHALNPFFNLQIESSLLLFLFDPFQLSWYSI